MARRASSSAGQPVLDVPHTKDLAALARAAAGCQRCELYRLGTQTVFGEGRRHAWLVVVGEQPGDREDLAGRPFVGPAGRLMDEAFDEAGLDRDELYLTNAVKHFRWEPRGKRRIHKTPSTEHVRACLPWLEAEMAAVGPQALLCLGAVAAKAVFGSSFRLLANRGKQLSSRYNVPTIATVHPSAVLRSDNRQSAYESFVNDVRAVLPLRPAI